MKISHQWVATKISWKNYKKYFLEKNWWFAHSWPLTCQAHWLPPENASTAESHPFPVNIRFSSDTNRLHAALVQNRWGRFSTQFWDLLVSFLSLAVLWKQFANVFGPQCAAHANICPNLIFLGVNGCFWKSIKKIWALEDKRKNNPWSSRMWCMCNLSQICQERATMYWQYKVAHVHSQNQCQ